MERGKEKRYRTVIIDPVTKKILYDPQGERDDLQRKIRDAALVERKLVKGWRWKVPNGQGPELNEDQKENQADLFFSEITMLIWSHKSLMDKKAFVAECQDNIDKKLKRARERIELEVKDLGGIKKKTCKDLIDPFIKKIKTEMERCLKKPPNRMGQMVNEVVCMNPGSRTWKKREDDLIKKIVGLYDEYTPLKKQNGKLNALQVAHNLNLIFKACGISDISEQTLRKLISSILPTCKPFL